jgi:Protein of unknown function (DUF4238)
MAIARIHHYVPQMYLTGFANDKDQCFVVDASTRKSFTSSTANIAAERDYNTIEVQGVPADALERELAKLEGVIAPGIKCVRETASFGENGKDREDIINLIAILAVRNPRTRNDMGKLYIADLRHALAHRIPLYIPPYVIQAPDEAAYKDFETKMSDAIKKHDFAGYDRLSAEQMKLGRFRPWVQHSFEENAAPIVFHAQTLADFNTVEELGRKMLDELRR